MRKPDFRKMSVGERWNLEVEVIKAVFKTCFTIISVFSFETFYL